MAENDLPSEARKSLVMTYLQIKEQKECHTKYIHDPQLDKDNIRNGIKPDDFIDYKSQIRHRLRHSFSDLMIKTNKKHRCCGCCCNNGEKFFTDSVFLNNFVF